MEMNGCFMIFKRISKQSRWPGATERIALFLLEKGESTGEYKAMHCFQINVRNTGFCGIFYLVNVWPTNAFTPLDRANSEDLSQAPWQTWK